MNGRQTKNMNTRTVIGSGVAAAIVIAATSIWWYEKRSSEAAAAKANVLTVPLVAEPLEARIDAGKLTLIGQVPDQESHQSLVTEAKRRFGADQVTDTLTVNGDLSGFMWYHSEAIFLPLAIRGVERGVAKFDGSKLTLDGFVRDGNMKTEVETAASVAANGRFSVNSRLQLQAAVEAPVVASAAPSPDPAALRGVAAKALQEKLDRFLADKPIEFEPDRVSLASRSFAVLDQLAPMLAQSDFRIEVSGHTDNVGDAERNVRLSGDRAEEVCRYLSRKGVAPERLLPRGYGAAQTVAFAANDAGTLKRRRIVFRVLEGR